MTSQKQIEANRRNAQKSTGPTSPEGKETASQNAATHGMYAKRRVMRWEDEEEYEAFYVGLMYELDPQSPLEHYYAETFVENAWRTRRGMRYEVLLNEKIEDPIELMREINRLSNHEAKLDRMANNALRSLDNLKITRQMEAARQARAKANAQATQNPQQSPPKTPSQPPPQTQSPHPQTPNPHPNGNGKMGSFHQPPPPLAHSTPLG